MNGIIRCSCCGNFGRFGNSLFQFCMAKSYAEKYNCILEVPQEWVGRKIFNISEPYISSIPLKKTQLDKIPWGAINIDLFGYFQFEEALRFMSLAKIRSWLKFQDRWTNIFAKKESYTACHIRRGDFVDTYSHVYCIIKERSYVKALEKFNLNQDNIVWVKENKPMNRKETDVEGVPFLPDFMTLCNSDIMLRANSTFSLWAGILANNKVYSPIVDGLSGEKDVEFVEGNYPKIVGVGNWGSVTKPCNFVFGE